VSHPVFSAVSPAHSLHGSFNVKTHSIDAAVPRMDFKRGQQLEFDYGNTAPACGEQQLWQTVILWALKDYEQLLESCQHAWRSAKKPISRHALASLQNIRLQCQSEWFQFICELADISPHHIHRRISELDSNYELALIPVDPVPAPALSIWQRRRARLKARAI